MRSLPVVVLVFLLCTGIGVGLWVWWVMPPAFIDTIKHVASTKPVELAVESTSLAGVAIPLAEDLSSQPGTDWSTFLGPGGDGVVPQASLFPWDASGPKVVWYTDMGEGYSAGCRSGQGAFVGSCRQAGALPMFS